MTNLSEILFKVGDETYTLFLNRKGVVSWENITKCVKKINEIDNKYKDFTLASKDEEDIQVKDGDNPFDFGSSEELSQVEKDEEMIRDIYTKFYWIALYEKHKLNLSEVQKIFKKAEEEYGIEQLMELANKMVEQVNTNKYNKELKKLEALNQMK